MVVMLKDGRSMPDDAVIDYLAESGINLERIEGGYTLSSRTVPYTTTPKPESIQKEPFKLWKGLGSSSNRKEH